MRSTLGDRFASHFREVLVRRYKRCPSAAFVAVQFNFHAKGSCEISGETARRWMRGNSLPRYEHLDVLSRWLDLDVKLIFSECERNEEGFIARIRQVLSECPLETQKSLLLLLEGLHRR